MNSFVAAAPLVQISGVFINAWIFCGFIGMIIAFSCAFILSYWKELYDLSQSTLLFCCVMITSAIMCWWFVYRNF